MGTPMHILMKGMMLATFGALKPHFDCLLLIPPLPALSPSLTLPISHCNTKWHGPCPILFIASRGASFTSQRERKQMRGTFSDSGSRGSPKGLAKEPLLNRERVITIIRKLISWTETVLHCFSFSSFLKRIFVVFLLLSPLLYEVC